ncbi:MAG: hypothetical protein IT307_10190, partial [Chloroflexi bacterium]|nr:hypothetical protein [Chloroflexota bacterium]
ELALNRLRAEDLAGAREALSRGAEAAERLRCLPCSASFAGVAAECWAALGEPEQTDQNAREALRLGRQLDRQPPSVAGQRATAALAEMRGDRDSAARLLRATLRLCRAVEQPYEAALTALQLAHVLGGSRRSAELSRARGLTRSAVEAFERLGAHPDLQAARRAAARLGSSPAEPELRLAR